MPPFTLATWNVNSIAVRGDQLERWLKANTPDLICLQELKKIDFPQDRFAALGYQCAWVGQKAYNGVALLARAPIHVVTNVLPGDPADDQARFLHARVYGCDVIGIYAPNGNPADGPKYPYKLSWYDRLIAYVSMQMNPHAHLILLGDFNIIPTPADCHDPATWQNDALFRRAVRAKYRTLIHQGLTDALHAHKTRPDAYSFWDYQAGCWPKNHGIRIDHVLLSPVLADCVHESDVDRTPRGWDQPSDHAPVIVRLTSLPKGVD